MLQQTVPHRLQGAYGIADMPFPPDLAEGLTDDEVDVVFQTVDGEARTRMLRYRTLAVLYLAFNAEAPAVPPPQPGPWNGGDGRVRHLEIRDELRRLRAAGVRVPAVFFLWHLEHPSNPLRHKASHCYTGAYVARWLSPLLVSVGTCSAWLVGRIWAPAGTTLVGTVARGVCIHLRALTDAAQLDPRCYHPPVAGLG